MAAIDPATLDRWRTLSIVDRDGGTVGSISEFYLDRETRYPTWALVNVGLFGARQMFVPLLGATEIRDGLQVPYEKSHIKDAPRIDLHGELTPDEEATLFAHYGIEYQPAAEEAGVGDAAGVAGGGVAGAAGAAGVAGAAGAAGAAAAGATGSTEAAEDAAAEARAAEAGDDEPGVIAAEAEGAERGAEAEAAEDAGPAAAEPGSPEHAAAAAEQDPAAPEEWVAGRQPADDGNPGRAPATDELAWPASPPPPGPITEPPGEPPEVPRSDPDR
jgi:PRC-barrel domain protein